MSYLGSWQSAGLTLSWLSMTERPRCVLLSSILPATCRPFSWLRCKIKRYKIISWHRLSPWNYRDNLTQNQNNKPPASDSSRWCSWDLKCPEKVSLPLSLCLVDSFWKTLRVIANGRIAFLSCVLTPGPVRLGEGSPGLKTGEDTVHRGHSPGRLAGYWEKRFRWFFDRVLFKDEDT